MLYVKGGAAVISDQVGLASTLTGLNLATVNSTSWGGTIGPRLGAQELFYKNYER
jgi:hypothetical protein